MNDNQILLFSPSFTLKSGKIKGGLNMQRSLLTKELDDALDAYENPGQKKDEIKEPAESFWAWLGKSLFGSTQVTEPSPDPLKFLLDNASLALIEAAAKNKLSYVKRLVKVDLIQQAEYFEVVYLALVAAAQGGHSEVFNVFFTKYFARVMPQILEEGMEKSIISAFAIPTRFESIDFTWHAARQTTQPLANCLGLQEFPNLLTEAAHYGRLDMVRTLISCMPQLLNLSGYHSCLRAAEAGHVAVMEEFLEYIDIRERVFSNSDIIYAAQRQVAVVDRVLELHEYSPGTMVWLLRHTLHYGSAEVIERLLKDANVDGYLKYEGDDKACIEAIEECGYRACYVNTSKSAETAARMFQMLLKYPVIAQLAEKYKDANNDANVVYAVLKKLRMIPAKPIQSTKGSLSRSGLFLERGLAAEADADEEQSRAESSYRS